jgi:hypothetical protein
MSIYGGASQNMGQKGWCISCGPFSKRLQSNVYRSITTSTLRLIPVVSSGLPHPSGAAASWVTIYCKRGRGQRECEANNGGATRPFIMFHRWRLIGVSAVGLLMQNGGSNFLFFRLVGNDRLGLIISFCFLLFLKIFLIAADTVLLRYLFDIMNKLP